MTSSAKSGLIAFATGGGVVVWILWAAMSIAPPFDLIFDQNGTNPWLNTLFMLTGPIPLMATLYVGRYITAPLARPDFDAWMKSTVMPRLTILGAAWITGYAFI